MDTQDLHDSKILSMMMASPQALENRHSASRTFSSGQWICLKSLSRSINTCIDYRWPQSRYLAQFRRPCSASLTIDTHLTFFRPASSRRSFRNNQAPKVIQGSAPSSALKEQILLRFRNVQATASACISTQSSCRGILIDEPVPGITLKLQAHRMPLFPLLNRLRSQSMFKKQ